MAYKTWQLGFVATASNVTSGDAEAALRLIAVQRVAV